MLSFDVQIMVASGVCFVLDSNSPTLTNTMMKVLETHWDEFEIPIKKNIISEFNGFLSKKQDEEMFSFVQRKVI